MNAYKLTVYATNAQYSSKEDISTHYVSAKYLNDAIAHVREYMEKAGWVIRRIDDESIFVTVLEK